MLGPDYAYYDYIKTPGELGMSPDGNLSATADDVGALINYVGRARALHALHASFTSLNSF